MSDSPPFPDDSSRFRRGLWLSRGTLFQRSVVAAMLALVSAGVSAAAADETLPVPRFASLKSSEVNLRTGPGEDRPKLWVYQRAGMPVEIIEEFDTWRRIRDYQGVVGWVSGNLLSGKRTAIITEARRTMHESPDPASPAVAEVDPGVIARLEECRGEWCRIEVKGYEGWLKREEFWGVYPDEAIKE
jgi:SH3-like domain-containing protein